MFTDRDTSIGILYVTAYTPGAKMKTSVLDGDDVTLKIGDEDILVRDVCVISPGQYAGTIYGFEPSQAMEFSGLKVDEHIEFSERHVISCHGR